MTEIRAARAADEAELAGIDAVSWSPDVTPAGERPADAPFFTDRTSPEDVLVALVDAQVAGYVSLRQTIPLPSHQHVLEVSGLAVDPRFADRASAGDWSRRRSRRPAAAAPGS